VFAGEPRPRWRDKPEGTLVLSPDAAFVTSVTSAGVRSC